MGLSGRRYLVRMNGETAFGYDDESDAQRVVDGFTRKFGYAPKQFVRNNRFFVVIPKTKGNPDHFVSNLKRLKRDVEPTIDAIGKEVGKFKFEGKRVSHAGGWGFDYSLKL